MYSIYVFLMSLMIPCLAFADLPASAPLAPVSVGEVEEKPLVLVTVAPHRYLVKRIAGDTVDVDVIVPPTANVHTFEPSPKQMLRASQADIWFRIGEFFETQLAQALKSHHPSMVLVDLKQNLDLIYADEAHVVCCHHHGGADLHFWLSPKQLMIQARNVSSQLSALFPQYAERYQEALQSHLSELEELDRQLHLLFLPMRGRTILVTHPAYGYLCRDYGLQQLTVEVEGKEPTPKQLTQLIRKAKELHIHTLFSQVQYPAKIAERVQQELGPRAKIVTLDPYAEDYMVNIRNIANYFFQG